MDEKPQSQEPPDRAEQSTGDTPVFVPLQRNAVDHFAVVLVVIILGSMLWSLSTLRKLPNWLEQQFMVTLESEQFAEQSRLPEDRAQKNNQGIGRPTGEVYERPHFGLVATVTEPVPAPQTSRTVTLEACTQLVSGTRYELQEDLVVDHSPCLWSPGIVHGERHVLTNVVLDCNGHALTFDQSAPGEALPEYFEFVNADHLVVQNCVLRSDQSPDVPVEHATRVTTESAGAYCFTCDNTVFQSNVFQGVLHLRDGTNTRLLHNVFYDGALSLFTQNDVTIRYNRFIHPLSIPARAGAHTRIEYSDTVLVQDNTFQGGSRTLGIGDGYDNAVSMFNATDVTLSQNTLADYWGCGMEFAGPNDAPRITHNTLDRMGTCAIGGWWWLSLRDAYIGHNVAQRTPILFDFARVFGLRRGDPLPYFENNTFEYNTLTQRAATTERESNLTTRILFDRVHDEYLPLEDFGSRDDYRPVIAEDMTARGNIFRHNRIDSTLPVLITPARMIAEESDNAWLLCTDYAPTETCPGFRSRR